MQIPVDIELTNPTGLAFTTGILHAIILTAILSIFSSFSHKMSFEERIIVVDVFFTLIQLIGVIICGNFAIGYRNDNAQESIKNMETLAAVICSPLTLSIMTIKDSNYRVFLGNNLLIFINTVIFGILTLTLNNALIGVIYALITRHEQAEQPVQP